MSAFITRVEADVLIVKFETPAGLNDFRNNALRDALYELVQNRPDPVLAVDLMKLDRFFTIADDESQALASLRPLPTA